MASSSPSEPLFPDVRPATEADYRAIAAIQAASPEAAQWPLGDYSGTPVLIARFGAEPAGFCAWRQTAPDEAELLNLAVHPDYRRRGVATALIKALSAIARGTLFLEVAEPNLPAIALYRSQGWIEAGIRNGYYSNGLINAVVMRKRSC